MKFVKEKMHENGNMCKRKKSKKIRVRRCVRRDGGWK